jgi:hypothetical protein
MRRLLLALVTCLSFLGGANTSQAGIVPYPNIGTANPTVYNFTASFTGTIVAYFAGSSASYNQDISMLVNGVPTGIFGLNNHSSSIGQSLVLGNVTAGDILTFVDRVNTIGKSWFSNPALNLDGLNHIYSTSVTAGQISALIPAGTYIGFEDLVGGGDRDYNDVQFVFVNVASAVPEPATWAMMLVGFLGLAHASRRRRLAAAV